MNTESDLNTASSQVEAAFQALKKGDRRAARRCAEQAASLAPQTEQPWLILAYLASPDAANYYLDRALQVNPASQRALAGKVWLKKQSHQPNPAASSALPAAGVAQAVEKTPDRQKTSLPRAAVGFLIVAVLAGLVILGGAFQRAASQAAPAVTATQAAVKASLTLQSSLTSAPSKTTVPVSTSTTVPSPSITASPIPTGTSTSVPTATSSPIPTSTPTTQPTAAPTQTKAPSPTPIVNTPVVTTSYTVAAGDSLSLIAQRYQVSLQSLINANNLVNPSFIQAGQVLTIPRGGQALAAGQPEPTSIPAGTNGAGKQILIDISEQHMYAYQDDNLVFSLVVSTGIGDSTRVGTFKVLDKIPKAYSSRFNIWMPFWLGIYYSGTLENGIHGLPLLMNGVELWGSLLGKPATYGCIESRTPDIKKLYDWAEIGTTVIIRR